MLGITIPILEYIFKLYHLLLIHNRKERKIGDGAKLVKVMNFLLRVKDGISELRAEDKQSILRHVDASKGTIGAILVSSAYNFSIKSCQN
jgi:hypothetical protein